MRSSVDRDYVLLRPTDEEIDELQVFDFDQADVDFVGIEAELLFEMIQNGNSHLHLTAFTDFVNAEEDATGDNLPQIPPMRFGLGLHGNWNQFDASIDAIFADDQTDVAPNELPTEKYTLLNASVSYAFADTDLDLFLKGTNLLDEEIRQHTSPLKDQVPLRAYCHCGGRKMAPYVGRGMLQIDAPIELDRLIEAIRQRETPK